MKKKKKEDLKKRPPRFPVVARKLSYLLLLDSFKNIKGYPIQRGFEATLSRLLPPCKCYNRYGLFARLLGQWAAARRKSLPCSFTTQSVRRPDKRPRGQIGFQVQQLQQQSVLVDVVCAGFDIHHCLSSEAGTKSCCMLAVEWEWLPRDRGWVMYGMTSGHPVAAD